jgi:hypothetical protein
MDPGDAFPIPAGEIQEEIRAVIHSSLFTQSPRNAGLLEYLCNKVLLGRQDEIKESIIALEVFDRRSNFDDKKDAIVRVEAYRLRQRLARYYATEGTEDRVMIELAPGGYIPKFVVRAPKPASLHLPVPSGMAAGAVNEPLEKRLRLTAKLGMAIVVLSAVVVGGPVLLARWNSLSHKAAVRPVDPASNALAAPPPLSGIRILAGSRRPYIDRAGHRWLADEYFNGGTPQPGPSDLPDRPPDPSLYRSMRHGDFSYDIPALPGFYELHLYFAEPIFRSGTDFGNEGGENQRHFTVTVNDREVLHDFDVVADSGRFPVDVRAFREITPAADGRVHLRFRAVAGPSFVNAIELVPGTPGHVLPIRIRAGDSSFTDHAGNVWSPDDYYVGGRLATHKGDVTGTSDPDLYATERYGNFSYSIPVPPGRYAVTLYFAETYWDPQGDSAHNGGAGSRVFDVACNGVALLKGFDMLAQAKPFHPIVSTFHNLRPNGQGKLLVTFSPVNNYASVKAIEVTEEER